MGTNKQLEMKESELLQKMVKMMEIQRKQEHTSLCVEDHRGAGDENCAPAGSIVHTEGVRVKNK
jgi:hypothetical protein